MKNERVLVLADQQLEGEGLVAILKNISGIELVSDTALDPVSVANFRSSEIDMIILDMAPGGSTLNEHCTMVRDNFPDAKLFIIGSTEDMLIVSSLFRFNISGYFLKSDGKEKLQQALDIVKEGEVYLSGNISRKVLSNFVSQGTLKASGRLRPGAISDKSIANLTARELDVLFHLANGQSSSQIADQLFISRQTVDTHRKRILKKMGFNNTATLIRFVVQNGLVD